jgi:hypothetical protein
MEKRAYENVRVNKYEFVKAQLFGCTPGAVVWLKVSAVLELLHPDVNLSTFFIQMVSRQAILQ